MNSLFPYGKDVVMLRELRVRSNFFLFMMNVCSVADIMIVQ
ncbi:MAG TPA: hypothetical protein VD927_03310 [Chryseosolibacter sp.]|nr:hypothetical protein [Chryseosolibacter sp.]